MSVILLVSPNRTGKMILGVNHKETDHFLTCTVFVALMICVQLRNNFNIL